jgi:hypothetical protein
MFLWFTCAILQWINSHMKSTYKFIKLPERYD